MFQFGESSLKQFFSSSSSNKLRSENPTKTRKNKEISTKIYDIYNEIQSVKRVQEDLRSDKKELKDDYGGSREQMINIVNVSNESTKEQSEKNLRICEIYKTNVVEVIQCFNTKIKQLTIKKYLLDYDDWLYEVKMLLNLTEHQITLPYVDSGKEGDRYFIEQVAGQKDLRKVKENCYPYCVKIQDEAYEDYDRFLSISYIRLLQKLKKMHSLGYAHSDIKPQNFVIGYDFDCYFIDFGGSIKDFRYKDYLSSFTYFYNLPKYVSKENNSYNIYEFKNFEEFQSLIEESGSRFPQCTDLLALTLKEIGYLKAEKDDYECFFFCIDRQSHLEICDIISDIKFEKNSFKIKRINKDTISVIDLIIKDEQKLEIQPRDIEIVPLVGVKEYLNLCAKYPEINSYLDTIIQHQGDPLFLTNMIYQIKNSPQNYFVFYLSNQDELQILLTQFSYFQRDEQYEYKIKIGIPDTYEFSELKSYHSSIYSLEIQTNNQIQVGFQLQSGNKPLPSQLEFKIETQFNSESDKYLSIMKSLLDTINIQMKNTEAKKQNHIYNKICFHFKMNHTESDMQNTNKTSVTKDFFNFISEILKIKEKNSITFELQYLLNDSAQLFETLPLTEDEKCTFAQEFHKKYSSILDNIKLYSQKSYRAAPHEKTDDSLKSQPKVQNRKQSNVSDKNDENYEDYESQENYENDEDYENYDDDDQEIDEEEEIEKRKNNKIEVRKYFSQKNNSYKEGCDDNQVFLGEANSSFVEQMKKEEEEKEQKEINDHFIEKIEEEEEQQQQEFQEKNDYLKEKIEKVKQQFEEMKSNNKKQMVDQFDNQDLVNHPSLENQDQKIIEEEQEFLTIKKSQRKNHVDSSDQMTPNLSQQNQDTADISTVKTNQYSTEINKEKISDLIQNSYLSEQQDPLPSKLSMQIQQNQEQKDRDKCDLENLERMSKPFNVLLEELEFLEKREELKIIEFKFFNLIVSENEILILKHVIDEYFELRKQSVCVVKVLFSNCNFSQESIRYLFNLSESIKNIKYYYSEIDSTKESTISPILLVNYKYDQSFTGLTKSLQFYFQVSSERISKDTVSEIKSAQKTEDISSDLQEQESNSIIQHKKEEELSQTVVNQKAQSEKKGKINFSELFDEKYRDIPLDRVVKFTDYGRKQKENVYFDYYNLVKIPKVDPIEILGLEEDYDTEMTNENTELLFQFQKIVVDGEQKARIMFTNMELNNMLIFHQTCDQLCKSIYYLYRSRSIMYYDQMKNMNITGNSIFGRLTTSKSIFQTFYQSILYLFSSAKTFKLKENEYIVKVFMKDVLIDSESDFAAHLCNFLLHKYLLYKKDFRIVFHMRNIKSQSDPSLRKLEKVSKEISEAQQKFLEFQLCEVTFKFDTVSDFGGQCESFDTLILSLDNYFKSRTVYIIARGNILTSESLQRVGQALSKFNNSGSYNFDFRENYNINQTQWINFMKQISKLEGRFSFKVFGKFQNRKQTIQELKDEGFKHTENKDFDFFEKDTRTKNNNNKNVDRQSSSSSIYYYFQIEFLEEDIPFDENIHLLYNQYLTFKGENIISVDQEEQLFHSLNFKFYIDDNFVSFAQFFQQVPDLRQLLQQFSNPDFESDRYYTKVSKVLFYNDFKYYSRILGLNYDDTNQDIPPNSENKEEESEKINQISEEDEQKGKQLENKEITNSRSRQKIDFNLEEQNKFLIYKIGFEEKEDIIQSLLNQLSYEE